MNAEDEKIIKQFNDCFINSKSNPIVIYGIGAHTRVLLENTDLSRIVGLMDKSETGKTIYGKKVLSLEEVVAIKNVIIVILARKSVINVIYRRIEDVTAEKRILVFDINGNEIQKLKIDNKSKTCFQLNYDELEKLVDEVEYVSFDIFDTLLCRSVLRPVEVFDLVENRIDNAKDFKNLRIQAEERLTGNYHYEEIYDELKKFGKYGTEAISELKQLEVEMEKKCLIRREKMCELLEYVYSLGKRVILISDMYFSKKQIENFLMDKGITEYDAIYVSSDMGSSKNENLYEIVKEQENLTFDKWLHIGDNEISDIEMPRKYGIRTYRIYSTIEMLEESVYSPLIDMATSIEGDVAISLFAAKVYNNPFDGYDDSGKMLLSSDEDIMSVIVAPIISKYMRWIVNEVKNNDIDYVVFPSRDGFLLKDIYDEISKSEKLPGDIYLYTSRRATMVAAAYTKEDINKVLEFPDDRTFSEMAKSRFGVGIGRKNSLSQLDEHDYKAMLSNAEEERNEYISYLRSTDIENHNKIAFIDFVAMGRIQKSIEKMLNKNFYGFYFLRRIPDCKEIEEMLCVSFLPMADDFSSESNVYKYYYYLENILSSDEPSVIKIKDGKPDFYSEKRNSKEIDTLMKCHLAIKEYCNRFFGVLPIRISEESIVLYEKILSLFSNDYSVIEKSILLDMENVDEFMGKKVQEFNR